MSHNGWTIILFLIAAILMLWLMTRMIRNNPHAFSKENLGKSLYTIGVLTLLLIAVVFFCVMLVRSA